MKLAAIGIDLAKAVFQVHGVDERDKVLFRKQLKRKDVTSFFANLQPCLIGMEACGSAHYWARTLSNLDHTVRLMAPQFVKPYVSLCCDARVTGDRTHFGSGYGKLFHGVAIHSPRSLEKLLFS